jgi:hypothetical protein
MKKTANIILQGKGGVGKSFISSIIAQYFNEQRGNNESIICVDTDPNNMTFSTIPALNAVHLELFENDILDTRKFDTLVMHMLENEDKDFVIDNGATTFNPLIQYIFENDTFATLADKFEVILHVPIVGGEAQIDTINGFFQLFEKWPNIKFVVWVNEFQGRIKDEDGNEFEAMDVYKKNKKNIFAVVYIDAQNPQTFGRDIEDMKKAKLTFAEVMQDARFNVIAKQRLKMFKDKIFGRLTLVYEKIAS